VSGERDKSIRKTCYISAMQPVWVWSVRLRYKGRKVLTGTDKDIFGWLTLNNCSITSCRTLYCASAVRAPPVWNTTRSGEPSGRGDVRE